MGNFEFIQTKDGSIGLFNKDINDIYHAREGAYSEAIEKFVTPAINFLRILPDINKLNICDICYGIGYNTFAFLELFLSSNLSDKVKYLRIDALEYDKELIILSPFLKNNNMGYIIRNLILKSIRKIYTNFEITEIVNKHKLFTNTGYYNLFKGGLKYNRLYNDSLRTKRLFLHNTYYNYISYRFKKALKVNNINKISIVFHDKDARKSIFNVPNGQNLVFLDAFDPKKLPTLWSKEFFDAIYSKADAKFKMFTYSHAACIRSAMTDANFYIGNNFGNGTSASKNKNFITDELSDYEKGLLNTSAGICFRDYNLNGSKDELIQDRLRRVKLENRESSTHYAKTHQK